MASTYSTNLGIELIGAGDQSGTWGTTTNNNLGNLFEQAVSGVATYACTGGTDTITIPNGASGTARNMFLELTGTGGGSLVVPTNKKLYFIYNNTSLAITVKVTGQTGVSVPAAAKTILVMNSAGTDVVNATNYFSALTLGTALPVASGGTGLATLTANNVILGNGASNPTFVAPTTAGNILTANGTTWVSSAPATSGTVTSIGVSGGTTGLTTSGGPITTSGTITLAGTLAVANGGTGVTSTTAYSVYTGNSAGTGFTAIANGTTDQILTATTSGAPSWSSAFNGTVGASTPTTGKFTTVTCTFLTSSRVLFVGSSGRIQDSARWAFDSTAVSPQQYMSNSTGSAMFIGVNTGATGEIYYGSESNSPLTFWTNNTKRITLSSAGLVGINCTPSGTYQLEVNGAVGVTGALTATGTITGTAALASGSTISDGTTAFSVGYLNIPQNAQSGNYTLVLADNGKHVYSTNSGTQTITVPTNASVAFPVGTALTIVNNGTTSITISTTSLTVYQAGTTNTGDRTLATKGVATLLKVDTNTWFISGSGVS